MGRVRQKQAISGERGYYVPNQELILLDEALSPSCEFVQPGVEWIDKLSLTEKKRVVDAMPFLPYAVIVDQVAFEKIRSGKHKFRFHSDFTVPIVNLEAVREVRNLSREDIVFTCDCAELIIDEQRFSLYIAGIDNNIKEVEKEIESALERVGEINKKHVRVATFCENYPACKVTEANDRVHNYMQRITDIESEQETCKQKEDMFITEKAAIEERIEKLVAAIIDGEDEALKLQSFIDKSGQFNALTIQINENKREHRGIEKKLVQLRESEQELASSLRVLWDRIGDKKDDMRDVKKEIVPLLSFDRIETELLLEDVRAAYIAGRDAVEGRSVAESSLREKITIGRQDLENLRDRVLREYGRDLEDVKQREGSGAEIFIPSRNEIIHLTQEKAGLGEQVTAKGKEITAVYGKIERAKGTLENIFGGVPEEYHQDIPDYEDERQYTREIRDTEQLIQNLRDEEGKLNIEADRLKNEQSTASHQLEGYERFLEIEEIELDHTVKSEIREFRSFERGYLEQKNNLGELQGKWSDKLRVIERETIEFVIREPLDELSKMGMPVGVAQCGRKKEAFVEYILNLEEQMKKISQDIEKLEGYQKDFARRCIQRADLVLGDLRKLEALSRIEYDGRRVEMIRVRLNEFDDTEKQLRMKSHIDQIVREIGEEGTIDRHRVATRLATRELLAQIVDMDRARVMLFKVEGISEHSKHYRWEQALGSEGQNNSLYFIFAACLISYIRMLSITNTSANTKKVIVADNPFGSTSAVYLWDPMFKVLKQNNIQLIAPGHGIRRETTSRFSVNYLLNQDILQDGRRRVVVKDVRVEEDEEYMKYVDSEQMALFEG